MVQRVDRAQTIKAERTFLVSCIRHFALWFLRVHSSFDLTRN